jgi:type II secretory pathway pseudopilin PulG
MKQTLSAVWSSSRRDSRPAVAAMWALVVLSVLTIVMAAITWQVLAGRRFLERRQNQMQAVWLARSGFELAATRLLSNQAGEESLQLTAEWEVHVQVQRDSSSPDIYSVTSEARYPTNGNGLVVRSLTRRLRRVVEEDRVRMEVVVAAPGNRD